MEPVANTGAFDCTFLDEISEETILENLRLRFKIGKTYTYIRELVVSVNPYRRLGVYSDDYIAEYRSTDLFERPPHIYAIADAAFHGMVLFRRDASVIISGESGSGKTSASKYLMQYIATLTPHAETRVRNQLIVTNPLLEAFGNARTTRNNNASRFGKYVHIAFNLDIKPRGGELRTYLLEKARVVKQQPGERNFHCFYQLLAGADDKLLHELQLEKDPSKYRYLVGSSPTAASLTSSDEKMFGDVLKAMTILKFSEEDIAGIRKVLAAIVHLGNVDFTGPKDGHFSRVTNQKQVVKEESYSLDNEEFILSLSRVGDLLGTSADTLSHALTHKAVAVSDTTSDVTETKRSILQACHARDTLAKTLYERLFQLIVNHINKALTVNQVRDAPTTVISILDFYGFESFEMNGFEQFCINYCNERIQQFFIDSVLKTEQEVYVSEGLEWENVKFTSNESTCRMIESMIVVMKTSQNENGMQIVTLFDENYSEVEGYHSHNSGSKEITSNKQFQIAHYAGDVIYNVKDFTEKNSDEPFHDFKGILHDCRLPIIKQMFPEGGESITKATAADNITVGEQFKNDICELMERLKSQTPHWIRCIIPNLERNPKEWNHNLVLKQVRYLGLVESAKVQRTAYAHRMTYEEFVRRYKMLDKKLWPTNSLTPEQATKKLVSTYDLSEVVVFGKTQIFFKTQRTIFRLEAERQKKLPYIGMIVFRAVKGHYWKHLRHKMKALMTMLIVYRRKYVRAWFDQVVESFRDCSTMTPDYGRSIKWPKPPPAMKLAHRLLKRIHLTWWAKMRITHISPARQYQLRIKTIAFGFLHGKKPNLQLGQKWIGDEVGNRKLNPRAQEFIDSMTAYQGVNGDTKRLYSCHVTKLNRRLKSDHRVFVLCDKHLYRLTTDYQLAKRGTIELEMITGLSISIGKDQAVVIHCVRRIGDCVCFLENGRPVSEFLAVIWNLFLKKYERRLPVKVTDTMRFARVNEGIDIGEIVSEESARARVASFKRTAAKRVTVTWPTNGSVHKH